MEKKLPLVAYVIGVRSRDKGIYNSASVKIAHSRLFLCRLPLGIVVSHPPTQCMLHQFFAGKAVFLLQAR